MRSVLPYCGPIDSAMGTMPVFEVLNCLLERNILAAAKVGSKPQNSRESFFKRCGRKYPYKIRMCGMAGVAAIVVGKVVDGICAPGSDHLKFYAVGTRLAGYFEKTGVSRKFSY